MHSLVKLQEESQDKLQEKSLELFQEKKINKKEEYLQQL